MTITEQFPFYTRMTNLLFERIFPLYVRFWPTRYWLAMWSAPDYSNGETGWAALRVTIREGSHHSDIVAVIKPGLF